MKYLVFILLAVALFATALFAIFKHTGLTYIETPYGLYPEKSGSCSLGVLLNHDGINILDKDGKPITCSGYVKKVRGKIEEV